MQAMQLLQLDGRCILCRKFYRLWLVILLAFTTLPTYAVSDGFFSYLGGENNENIFDAVSDARGNLFVVGQTHSRTLSGIETQFSSSTEDQNCFISRLDLDNPQQHRGLIFGGNRSEVCRQVIVDDNSMIFVIGETQSTDFPVTNNSRLQGNWDGFLAILDENLTITAATYIGGSETDFAHGLDIFTSGKLAIVGETWSTDFPTTPGAYIEDCLSLDICDTIHANAFLYVINQNDLNLSYSTYLGGSHNDKAHQVITQANTIMIVGETQSSDYPLIRQLNNNLKGNLDAFVAKFEFTNDSEAQLAFSSYLGGNGADSGLLIANDTQNHLVIAGETSSDDFPVSESAFSRQCGNGETFCLQRNTVQTDIFVAQIDMNQFTLAYATLYGGSKNEMPSALTIDADSTWWLSGLTRSVNLPITNNARKLQCAKNQNQCQQNYDSFILNIDPTLNTSASLRYASYFGGDKSDLVKSITVRENQLLIVGDTFSEQLASRDAFKPVEENGDGFIQAQALPSPGQYIAKPKPIQAKQASGGLNPSILLWLFTLLCYWRLQPRSTKTRF